MIVGTKNICGGLKTRVLLFDHQISILLQAIEKYKSILIFGLFILT